ncbi:S-adenosyl-L-methionine-dependent methyltransferase superfamily protein [Forsythia ovata]|uniref:S-adenosyl-L-methionine-dependent methyltransferase superfamily protein n=1 Tax=Forsythia ovata TaxID=205694 RepID=A0ABD1TPS6_9LAMI
MAMDKELDLSVPSCIHLLSAFLAMEPPDVVISFARECGGDSITEIVQSFIWNHCISKADVKWQGPYLKRFLKKLIVEIESSGGVVLDELYEQYAFYMTSLQDDDVAKENSRVLKRISFLFPDESSGILSCPKSRKLEVQLQCSLNMLEGDTGCSIWPSSLFLSEFILSFPEIFSNKCCFEVGSGVGLVGICLAHVKASKVILSDGNLSTLANMKLNLELNHLRTGTHLLGHHTNCNMVNCVCLPWESASEDELRYFSPDIILGADVVYDPSYLPHLVRVLVVLLKCENSDSEEVQTGSEFDACQRKVTSNATPNAEFSSDPSVKGCVAYIASVVRNIDTLHYFLSLAKQSNLVVTDLTEKVKPFTFLPYVKSYKQSSIRMFRISY